MKLHIMSDVVAAFKKLRLENERRMIEEDNIKTVDKEIDDFFHTGDDDAVKVFAFFGAVSHEKQQRDQDALLLIVARPLRSDAVPGIFAYEQHAGDEGITLLEPGQIDIKGDAEIIPARVKIMGVLVGADEFALVERELLVFIIELHAALEAEDDFNDILVHVGRNEFDAAYFQAEGRPFDPGDGFLIHMRPPVRKMSRLTKINKSIYYSMSEFGSQLNV